MQIRLLALPSLLNNTSVLLLLLLIPYVYFDMLLEYSTRYFSHMIPLKTFVGIYNNVLYADQVASLSSLLNNISLLGWLLLIVAQ